MMLSLHGTITTSSDVLKDRLSNLTTEELGVFRSIYRQELSKAWLRGNGWINLVLGAMSVWLGAGCICGALTFPEMMQIVLGGLLMLQSLSMIVVPHPSAYLRFAVLLLVIGLWNIGIAVFPPVRSVSWLVIALGIAQLWWALQTFQQHRASRRMPPVDISLDLNQLYKDTWRFVMRWKLKRDPDLIFLWVKTTRWRGFLLEDRVVFATRAHLLIIQTKDEVNFSPHSKHPEQRRSVYGQINLAGVFERAVMNRASFRKYAQWLGWENVLENVRPSWWERLPKFVRIPILIVIGLILAYFVGVIVLSVIMIIRYG